MDQSPTFQLPATAPTQMQPTCLSTSPEYPINLSSSTDTMTIPDATKKSWEKFHTSILQDTTNISTDQSISWLGPDTMDIWQQYLTTNESEMLFGAMPMDGNQPALEQTWRLIDPSQQYPEMTAFGSDTYPSSAFLNIAITEQQEEAKYGMSSGGNEENSSLIAMPTYASGCGVMSEPINGLLTTDKEWKDSCDAYDNSTDGRMSGLIPSQDSHLRHQQDHHPDMSHEHQRHPYTSHLLQPLIPIWNSSTPTPIPITGESQSCNGREHQRMMPYQSNPITTGQTQPTALEETMMRKTLEDFPVMLATSSTMKTNTQSTSLDNISPTMMTPDIMNMRSQCNGEKTILYGQINPESGTNTNRELQREVSTTMSEVDVPPEMRTTTASTTELYQDLQQFLNHTDESKVGNREWQSQLTNSYDEWELFVDQDEWTENENEAEGADLEKIDSRYGDEIRWEEYVEEDNNYKRKVSRVREVEKGVKEEIARRMKKDIKMMKGRRFDKSLAYYWGKEIVNKRFVSGVAYKVFGVHWRTIAVNIYRLYQGLEEDLSDDELGPWEIRYMKLKELKAENKKRRTLKALNKRK